MAESRVWVLWIVPGHDLTRCVQVQDEFLVTYRRRVVGEWRGRVLGVYRSKAKVGA
jgi:hypothetical protein